MQQINVKNPLIFQDYLLNKFLEFLNDIVRLLR